MTSASPIDYASVFRPACFSLTSVGAPGGIDIDIMRPGDATPLGTKRIFATGTASIDVAPYVRRLLSPAPLCGAIQGFHLPSGRIVSCYLSSSGFTSGVVALCGGTVDSPPATLLSAAPATVEIRPGEVDEIPAIFTGTVRGAIIFEHGGRTYSDISALPSISAAGPVVAVIGGTALASLWTRLTGQPGELLTGCTVTLTLGSRTVSRRYLLNHSASGGRRLAWFNRLGMIDYYTFPTVESFTSSGGHTAIELADGFRTVATSSRQSFVLVSAPCDVTTAEWLSEIFSSPAVWLVSGGEAERVEISAGQVECTPLRPTVVRCIVTGGERPASRSL